MQTAHEGHAIARKFFTGTSSTYDSVVNITTFGRDSVWKRFMLDLIPQGNYRVLDLACGTGILSLAIARKVDYVVGIDMTEDSIRITREKARTHNIKNASFYVSVAEAIPYTDRKFDFVTASYLPKYCNMELVVSEITRILKRGGTMIMHDFTYPTNAAMRSLWNTYFKILRVSGIFVPSWSSVFNELDGVIRESDWVNELVKTMERHGFIDIKIKNLTCGTAAIVWGTLG